MVMIEKIEKYIMYRAALELIAHEEAYDKKKNVLNGKELFKLCHERYLFMQQLLLPLKEKLGKEIEVTNISFANGIQDDTCIIVEYVCEGKKNYFTVSHLEFDNFETIFNTGDEDIKKFILENKDVFLDTFNDAYKYSFDREVHIQTASKQFVFTDDNETFALKDSFNGETLCLSGSHQNYSKAGALYISNDKLSSYKNIAKLLKYTNVVEDVFNHAKVYEEDLPKVLIKK